MQTIIVDGTRYRVKFDRDPIELAKLARKPWKPKKPKDIRKFPVRSDLTTAAYFRQFEELNNLMRGDYCNLNDTGTAHYDPTTPLFEVIE